MPLMRKNPLIWLLILAVLFAFFYLSRSDSKPVGTQEREASQLSFAGDECGGNCSGHVAGYEWAEEHDIDDEDDCDTAGDRSNSPSFAEGCKAFVNGENVDDDSTGDGDDDKSP